MTSLGGDTLATSMQLHKFDKGLRAHAMGEQLATIFTTTTLVRDHPFPMFVNQLVVRLAETFRDGTNELRLCVARVLSECSAQLALVFSGQEILKRILLVSHSNDPEARALTLQMLASLAPIFPDNKQVHHLIVESLATENEFEFKCACHAMAAFAHLSTEFSATIIAQLSSLLLSANTSTERKSLLVPVFAKMRSTVSTTQEVFELSSSLLETCTQIELVCALLNATTTLAEATRYAIPEQLTVLLACASRSEDNTSLAAAAISNLKRLAKHAHVWDLDHLQQLQQLKPKLEFQPAVFSRYLSVLVELSGKPRPAHLAFFEETIVLLSNLSICSELSHRIDYLHIGCNIYASCPSENLSNLLVDGFMCTVGIPLSPTLSKKFFRTMGVLMCCEVFPEERVSTLLSPVLNHYDATHVNIVQVAELLCLLSDRLPSVVPLAHNWVKELVKQKNNVSMSLLSQLLLAPYVNIVAGPSTVAPGSDADRYMAARVAFRNGHWRSAALPNLGAINTSRLSFDSSHWIKALGLLADCAVEDFTVSGLERQRRNLLKANSLMQTLLASSSNAAHFRFPALFVNCLLVSSSAIYDLMSGLSLFIHKPQLFSAASTTPRIRNLLSCCAGSLQKTCNAWSTLSRSSFGADQQSLDMLSLMHALYSCVLYAVTCMHGETAPSSVMLPVLAVETTSSKKTLQLITWAFSQLQQIPIGEQSEKSMDIFMSVLKAMYCHPIAMPRCFFQQFYSMDIKLSVVSGNNGELNVGCNQMVPIQLDGVISSSHPAPFDAVIITARVSYYTAQGNNTVVVHTVKPTDEIYFSTQFLMQFRQSCQIDFSVEFVDGDKRQQWTSFSTAVLRIMVNE